MKRFALLIALMILAACAVPKQEEPFFLSSGEKQLVATDQTTTDSYMTNQEEEIKRIALGTPFQITRENNILIITLSGADFFSESDYSPSPAVLETLKKIAAVLERYDKTHISIVGYAKSNKPAKDQRIPEKRAEAVAACLKQSAKIAPVRLWTEGHNSDAANNPQTDKNLLKNNYVDIILTPTFIR